PCQHSPGNHGRKGPYPPPQWFAFAVPLRPVAALAACYYGTPPLVARRRLVRLGLSTPTFVASVVGVRTVMYFLSCRRLASGIDSIESLILFSVDAEGTTSTSLSIRLRRPRATAWFSAASENSGMHTKPSRMSGSDSLGLNIQA